MSRVSLLFLLIKMFLTSKTLLFHSLKNKTNTFIFLQQKLFQKNNPDSMISLDFAGSLSSAVAVAKLQLFKYWHLPCWKDSTELLHPILQACQEKKVTQVPFWDRNPHISCN